MKKIIQIKESDLVNIVHRLITEQSSDDWKSCIKNSLSKMTEIKEEKLKSDKSLLFSFTTFKTGYRGGGGQTVEEKNKIVTYWSFNQNGEYQEYTRSFFGGTKNQRIGTYECKNGILTITDTKNKDRWSSQTKNWANAKKDGTQKTSSTGQPSVLSGDDIKKFQIFLDTYYDGWYNGGKLNNDVSKGWGSLGPRTKQMYNVKSIKSEFDIQKSKIK